MNPVTDDYPQTEQIKVIASAIERQAELDRQLRSHGVKDLVGDYGEILAHRALGGVRTRPTTEGHDIYHPVYGRIQVKTRKFELQRDGRIKREGRAAGFIRERPEQFDTLCHIVLNVDYSVAGAVLISYACAWPEITRTSMKIAFSTSSSLASRDITKEIAAAAIFTANSAIRLV